MISYNTDANSQNFISLGDIITTLRDNVLLLVLGPILVGIVSIIVTTSFERVYQSEFVLVNIRKVNIEALRLPKSVDSIASQLEHTKNLDPVEARSIILGNFKTELKKSGTLTISAFGKSSKEAFDFAKALQKEALNLEIPSKKLEYQATSIEKSIENKEAHLKKILTIIRKGGLEKSSTPEDIGNYINLINAANEIEVEVYNLKQSVLALQTSSNYLIQEPIINDIPLSRHTAQYAINSSLICGFILLFFIFLRKSIMETLKRENFKFK
jgi:hypothetical protein